MIHIENLANNKVDANLGLIQNVPKEVLSKLGINYLSVYSDTKQIEVIIISSSTKEELDNIVQEFNGTYEDLGFGFGIVTLSPGDLVKLSNVQTIQYIELLLSA